MDYDFIVVGGGMAGVCCAIAAAEEGSRVLLLQDRPVLGGNASSECGVPPHGAEALGHNRNLRESGILEELRLEFYCRRSINESKLQVWDALLWERCARVSNLQVRLNARVEGAMTEGNRIAGVTGRDTRTGEPFTYTAPLFADGTGNGTLGALAGAEYRYGREAASEFGEQELGRETADPYTLGCSIYGHAVRQPEPVTYIPPSDAIPYRNCEAIAHRAHDIHAIFPKLACKADYSEFRFFWWLEWGGELDVITEEAVIYDRLKRELFGLWDHLKNHCNEETREALACFALQDYTAFPLRRESRRLVGDYILTENDCSSGRIFEDAIGYGGWPMDDHPPMGIASKEPGCRQLFLSGPYTVPYRCCYSKNIENLFLLGRCMSVTHGALSSVRVMNTLGALGEAVGTAAALCREQQRSPRELGKNSIQALQQRTLRRDLYIPGQRRNLNFFPKISVTSARTLSGTADDLGRLELRYPTFLRLPLSGGEIRSFRILLEASQDTELLGSFLGGGHIEMPCKKVLRSFRLPVKAGTGWVELPAEDLPLSEPIMQLTLDPNPALCWHYGSEEFHTRWGIRTEGSGEGLAYHGSAKQLTREGWLTCNGCGRPTADAALWLREKQGPHCHDKLLVTPCFAIDPPRQPYGGENLRSGIDRGEALPNIWISEPELPQSCTLSWKEPRSVSRVELIFDTNPDYADQRYGFPRGDNNPDLAMPAVIRETVSDFTLELTLATGERITRQIQGNLQRRVILDTAVENVTGLKLTVTGTRGAPEARVFGIYLWES